MGVTNGWSSKQEWRLNRWDPIFEKDHQSPHRHYSHLDRFILIAWILFLLLYQWTQMSSGDSNWDITAGDDIATSDDENTNANTQCDLNNNADENRYTYARSRCNGYGCVFRFHGTISGHTLSLVFDLFSEWGILRGVVLGRRMNSQSAFIRRSR